MSSSKGKAMPDEMTCEDVEQRINEWKTNIDDIKRCYYAEAMHIGDVENRLDTSLQKLYNWIANVKLMQEKQKMLDKELDFINEQQKELTEEVANINIPQEKDPDSSIANTMDDINEKLASLNIEISKRSTEDVHDPKITIAKILNAQLSSLEILTQRIGQFRKNMSTVNSYEDYEDLGYEN